VRRYWPGHPGWIAGSTHVPFTEGQAIVNLLGGRIEGVVQAPAALAGQVKSGKLRVLAVLGEKRDPVFPTPRPPWSLATPSP
jgi:tripartite-type tricarboxylate transporter receptor subunit TctC